MQPTIEMKVAEQFEVTTFKDCKSEKYYIMVMGLGFFYSMFRGKTLLNALILK